MSIQNAKNLIVNFFEEYTKLWIFSGVVYVVKNDEILFEKASNMACHEFNIPNSVETCFSIGSISKQFTSFAIMQLLEKGLIDIDLPANNYLKENMKIDDRITVHHLMSHTSGLINYYSFEGDFFQQYDRSNFSKQDYFDRYINLPLGFEPGTKYEYCNPGYNLLAWIIEEVTGISFGDYLKENIFLPLGMKDTVLDDGTNIIKNKAYPYTIDRDNIVKAPYYNDKFSIGAGGVVSNCRDLYKWYRNLQNKGMLSNKSYERFFSDNMEGYCYGLWKDFKNEKIRYRHDGGHLGISTYMQNFFEDEICIIVLSNNDFCNTIRIGDSIGDIIFNSKFEIPKKLKEVKISKALANKYEGVYLDKKIELRCINEKWEFVRFNDNFRVEIYPSGENQFSRRYGDQFEPYKLSMLKDGTFEFFGFRNKSK